MTLINCEKIKAEYNESMGKDNVVVYREFAPHGMNEKNFDQRMRIILVSHWSNKRGLFLAGVKYWSIA